MKTAPSFDGTQLCKSDPELFFPEVPDRPTANDRLLFRQAIVAAKRICAGCPFVQPCLEYAIHNDVVGVWGATTEKERSQIRKTRRIPTPRSMTLVTNAWANKKGAR